MTRSKTHDNPLQEDIENLHLGADRIYEVVQQLSLYMRSRLSKNISGTSVNLRDLAAQKAELFKVAAAVRYNIIENKISADLSVHQNESLISIVLHNLMDNAIKNTENGIIVIDAAEQNNRVKLTVADSGKGLSPAQIKAYNDYFQSEEVANNKPVAGFGFLIIKEIAMMLKIKIEVKPAAEKGLVFELTITN